eukprot:1613748-Rhodomonas_salina.4
MAAAVHEALRVARPPYAPTRFPHAVSGTDGAYCAAPGGPLGRIQAAQSEGGGVLCQRGRGWGGPRVDRVCRSAPVYGCCCAIHGAAAAIHGSSAAIHGGSAALDGFRRAFARWGTADMELDFFC